VVALAVSSDGKVAASGRMFDPMLRLWEVATGKPLRVLKGHGDLIFDCALSADGKTVVSSSGAGVLQLWDVATGKELRRFEVEVPPGASRECLGVGTLRLSADGKRVAAIAILSDPPVPRRRYYTSGTRPPANCWRTGRTRSSPTCARGPTAGW
jgi:WD40 repeat protein